MWSISSSSMFVSTKTCLLRAILQHSRNRERESFCYQVMAEAADLCAHTIIHHCHAARLVRPLSDTVCKDKNTKMRLCSSKCILQASVLDPTY